MTEGTNPAKILILGAAAVVVLVIAIFLGMRLAGGPGDDEVATTDDTATAATPAPVLPPTPVPTPSDRLAGIVLATSDGIVREMVAEVSANPTLAKWLVNEDLVRRATATLQNIADGASPRGHLDFMAPKGSFQVMEQQGELLIDPASYRRYDRMADVIGSLDAEGTVALYRELRPLVLEAYAEIARPGHSFDRVLETAIDELLEVPILEDDVVVEEKVVTYRYADPRLENLSEAQRHLLRMGPRNVRIVKNKLREIRQALAAR
jgi:hypothetical protein